MKQIAPDLSTKADLEIKHFFSGAAVYADLDPPQTQEEKQVERIAKRADSDGGMMFFNKLFEAV